MCIRSLIILVTDFVVFLISLYLAADFQVKRKYVTLQNLQQEQEQKQKQKSKNIDNQLQAEHSATNDPKQSKERDRIASQGVAHIYLHI